MRFGDGPSSVTVNIASRAALDKAVRGHFAARNGFALATLNLDHLVKLRHDPVFAAAYRAQDLVVADGNPIVWLSRLAKQPVALMPGSDLVVPMVRMAAEAGVPVALVGSTDAALNAAKESLMAQVPGLTVSAIIAPPFGFDPQGDAARDILKQVAASGAGLCLIALGAPKQEVFAALGREVAPRVGFASIGAGLDFLGGSQNRAPVWVRRFALEWVWRMLLSPARLGPRYARCIAILPGLVAGALRAR